MIEKTKTVYYCEFSREERDRVDAVFAEAPYLRTMLR